MIPRITQQYSVNTFVITTGDGQYLQSYRSIVTHKDKDNRVTLGSHWDYSRTTSKYRSMFLNEDTKTTRAKLASGEYKYDEGLV